MFLSVLDNELAFGLDKGLIIYLEIRMIFTLPFWDSICQHFIFILDGCVVFSKLFCYLYLKLTFVGAF
jgi:hypothetical protein